MSFKTIRCSTKLLQRENASQAHKKSCAVPGGEVLKKRQCQNCFAKLRSGDFSFKDEKCSGRLVLPNLYSTTHEIVEKLHVLPKQFR